MYLRDFSRFFHFFVFKQIMQILFRYMLCYNVIILIQILIRYNVKNLITACTRSLDFDLPDPPPRSVAPLPRICHFFHSVPPPPPNALTHGTPLDMPYYIIAYNLYTSVTFTLRRPYGGRTVAVELQNRVIPAVAVEILRWPQGHHTANPYICLTGRRGGRRIIL